MSWQCFREYQLFWGVGLVFGGAGLCCLTPIGVLLIVGGIICILFSSSKLPAPAPQQILQIFEAAPLPERRTFTDVLTYQTREVVIRNPEGWQIGERSTTSVWARKDERY